MSSKVCDARAVVKIVADSAYKAVILDNISHYFLEHNDLTKVSSTSVFVASTVGYTIRGLARECGDEYMPSLSEYTQYIGGLVGGATKYLIKGIGGTTSLQENVILGAINNFGYEMFADMGLDTFTYVTSALVLEASEPILSHMFFKSNHELSFSMGVSAATSLIVSALGHFVYEPTHAYISQAADSAYNTLLPYMGYNNTIIHNDEL